MSSHREFSLVKTCHIISDYYSEFYLSLSSLKVCSLKWTSMNYLFFKISILHTLELMDTEFPF